MPTPIRPNEIIYNPEPVVFGSYCDGARLQARHAKSIAGTLRTHAPHDLPRTGSEQLDRIEALAIFVDDILTERQIAATVKPAFEDFGAAWGGMSDALLSKSRLPVRHSPNAPRAVKMHTQIFPEGAGFIRWDAHAAWSEGDRVLRVIAQKDLKSELDALIGTDFLQAAKKATTALREALGVGETPRETPSTTRLQHAMQRFSRALGRYARIVAADVDLDDAASVERFRKAVMVPFDQFRTRRTTSGEVESEEPETDPPSEPTQPVTPTPGPALPSPFIEET
ncbi:hypothetical protein [Sandaracinus amylolyticus]|uniref:Uncharacterized protein n=1 Tax=Sandaracinus amylolyticus TaxID=927083 RepID=A0A0F6YL24_9BACT|nr:hypothetical protein [Sandaracinus amylolyticus]AKF09860.1 hypothetical protein DB32_007009 [Sandaracinus amylolyticus]